MTRKTLHHQFICRRLQVVLSILLLMPVSVMAGDYGFAVAGVEVTDENAKNIFGTDFVSASYDSLTHTLLLNGCQPSYVSNQPFISIGSELKELIVQLKGCTRVEGYTSVFAAEKACSVILSTDKVVPGTIMYDYNGKVKDNQVSLDLETNGFSLTDDGIYRYIAANVDGVVSYFGIGQFHGAEEQSSCYEDYPAWDYSGWYYSNAMATDKNSSMPPTVMSEETEKGYVSRIRTDGDDVIKSLTFQCVPVENEGTIQVALMSPDLEETYATGSLVNGVVTLRPRGQVMFSNVCLTFISASPFSFVPMAMKSLVAEKYDIKVAGTQVTELNAANITAEFIKGFVSYDYESHTLTLSGATIGNVEDNPEQIVMETPGIDYSGTADLTIKLKGCNTVYGLGGCEAIRYDGEEETAPKLIFSRGDDMPCSLLLAAEQPEWISENFKERLYEGLCVTEEGETSAQLMSCYDLMVCGVQVHDGNKDNVTGKGISGPGSVSYDPKTSTLTLDSIHLNPDYSVSDGSVSIITSLKQLNINLIGESTSYAMMATNENCGLTFMSTEDHRGSARLSFWYSADPQFVGFGEGKVTYEDGLCLREDWTNQSFPKIVALYVPQVITDEPQYGLFYTDHQFKFSLKEQIKGFSIYYANMIGGGQPVKTSDGTFTLDAGSYVIRCYPIYPGMETDASWNSQFAAEIYPMVIEKPTFSVESGTYTDDFTVYLQHVPEQDQSSTWVSGSDGDIMVPQVWYYLNDQKQDSVRYDATKGIPVSESCKVSVYILDVDSGRVVKSEPVEAEYTVIPKTSLNISYDNNRLWASYYTEERNLETPEGLQAYIVSDASDRTVLVQAVRYIPKNVAVLLCRMVDVLPDKIMAKAYMGEEGTFTANKLRGTINADGKPVSSERGMVYVLYNDEFVKAVSGSSVPAQRGYLVQDNRNADARKLQIVFDDDVTGINHTLTDLRPDTDKVVLYNMAGQRMMESAKGLYIVNGKKIVIK